MRKIHVAGLFLVCSIVQDMPAWAQYNTTITNFNSSGGQVIKYDVAGNAVDAHDGKIALFNGIYYLYGTAYNCGFIWQTTGPFCGFKSYSSTDLVHWTDQGYLFDAMSSTWQSKCDGSTYGCFRPKVIYNASTKLYVLWFNAYDNASGYHVFTSTSPTGPFTQMTDPVLALNEGPGLNNGDEDLFVDSDGTAYIAYTNWSAGGGRIVVEQLNSSYISGTGKYSLTPTSSTEAPTLFKNGNTYYITYSNPNCGFCGGTGTAYMTSSNPLGTWSSGIQISSNSCGGQPSFVTMIPTPSGSTFLYGSDLWDNGNFNEGLANYFWTPLTFNADGSISAMSCQNTVSVNLTTGSAGAQAPLPPDVDSNSGVDGFTPWCDIGGNIQRSQAFVPSRSGMLTGVSFMSFQKNNPNAQLEVDIYATNGSSAPTGVALSTNFIPTASIGWSARYVTVHPNIVVKAGKQYAYVVKSTTTSGCYGFAYNDSNPYTAGGEEYSSNGGKSFSLESNRSAMFYVTVN